MVVDRSETPSKNAVHQVGIFGVSLVFRLALSGGEGQYGPDYGCGNLQERSMIESAERSATAPVEYAHGRQPAAWAGSIMAAVALLLGAAAFWLGPNWTLLWAALVLLVLALATGSVLRRLGYGQP